MDIFRRGVKISYTGAFSSSKFATLLYSYLHRGNPATLGGQSCKNGRIIKSFSNGASLVGEEGRMEQYCFIPFKQVALLDWKTAVREVEGEKT